VRDARREANTANSRIGAAKEIKPVGAPLKLRGSRAKTTRSDAISE
jgi:hypothetical protein